MLSAYLNVSAACDKGLWIPEGIQVDIRQIGEGKFLSDLYPIRHLKTVKKKENSLYKILVN